MNKKFIALFVLSLIAFVWNLSVGFFYFSTLGMGDSSQGKIIGFFTIIWAIPTIIGLFFLIKAWKRKKEIGTRLFLFPVLSIAMFLLPMLLLYIQQYIFDLNSRMYQREIQERCKPYTDPVTGSRSLNCDDGSAIILGPALESNSASDPNQSSISILFPNGGENLIRGRQYLIKWSDHYLKDRNEVVIYLIDTRSGSIMEIAPASYIQSSGLDGTSSYFWVVPANIIPGNNVFRIEIMETEKGTRGMSDGFFTIS